MQNFKKSLGEYVWGSYYIRLHNENVNMEYLKLPLENLPLNISDEEFRGYFSLIHEVHHLLQEFTLGSCLNKDFMKREMSYHVLNFMKHELNNEGSLTIPKTKDELELTDNGKMILKCQRNNKEFQSYRIEYKRPNNGKEKISSYDLLESYTHIKTLYYLKLLLNGKSLSDYSLSDETLELVNRTYSNNIYSIFKERINIGSDEKTYFWGFMIICDIALHTPPQDIIDQLIESNKCKYEDFIPIIRFFKILELIEKNKGFPPSTSSVFFGIELYNWVANSFNWPNYDITDSWWLQTLRIYYDKYKLSSYGYKLAMFAIKKRTKDEKDFYYRNPFISLGMTGFPIIYETNGKFILNNMLFDKNHNFIDYKAIIYPNTPREFMDLNKIDFIWDASIEEEYFNKMGLLSEISLHSMENYFTDNFINKKKPAERSCIWCKGECLSFNKNKCNDIFKIDFSRNNCILYKYLTGYQINCYKTHIRKTFTES